MDEGVDLWFLGEDFLCLGDMFRCLPEDEVREVEAPEPDGAADGAAGTESTIRGSSVPERPSSWLDGTFTSRRGCWNRKKYD